VSRGGNGATPQPTQHRSTQTPNGQVDDSDAPSDRHLGLTEREAARRREQGQGNDVAFATSRSFWQIVRDNAFMSINVIIFTVGVALILMGLVNDAIVTVGLVLANVAIAVVQEMRAKIALDRIALLSRMQATVIRDGVERTIDPAEIVLGDVIVAGSGDQVMVDGRIVESDHVSLDESLLTGESDPVSHAAGDSVYSGSFVVSGRMLYEAERVGIESRANQLTAQARAFRPARTPVQREIDLVLRLMIILIVVLGGPIVLDLIIRLLGLLANAAGGSLSAPLERAYQGYSVQETVRALAAVVSLMPQGLALMLTVTYAMGALRLAGKGALLQQANAIESISHVDVVCLDKTGTLTTNRLAFHEASPMGPSMEQLTAALGRYAATTGSRNRTIEAIAEAFPTAPCPVREEVPFSSAYKWSALSLENEPGTFVLGAPDVLLPAVSGKIDPDRKMDEWTEAGLRVLMLAWSPTERSLIGDSGTPRLPSDLQPYGLASFQDELQPDAATAFARFREAGIAVKIISGDHPETVAALTRQAGFGQGHDLQVLSGPDLAEMDEATFARAAESGEVFGRITPEQKLDIIRHLQQQGHYVAMIGDGVNDVLALKQAQVGIAMEQGSQATRAVADMVLLKNAFGVLPLALREGQRIVRSSQDLIRLFLARSLSMGIAIMGVGVVGAAFPLIPTHNALPALLTVGIPTVALAAWTQPGRTTSSLLRDTLPFVVPAALSIGGIEAMLYIIYLRITGDVELSRTLLTIVAVLCGLLLILFLRPPTAAWTGVSPLYRDWRTVALTIAMTALLVAAFTVERLREFFGLATLPPREIAIVILIVSAWALGIRHAWRTGLFFRLLGLDPARR